MPTKRKERKATTTQIYVERLQRCLNYISGNLDQPISFDTLAEVACFSPFHFHRIFRGLTGETVADLIRRIRMEYAYHLLHDQQQTVTTSTFETGYENVESFSRAFKKHFQLKASTVKKLPAPYKPKNSYAVSLQLNPLTLIFHPIIRVTNMKVRIEDIKAHPIAYIRHIGPYQEVGDTYRQLFGWARTNGAMEPMPHVYGFSWDDPKIVPASKLRFDAAISLPKDWQKKSDKSVVISNFPGGLWAITRHQGSHSEVGPVFHELMGRWIPTSGYLPDNQRPCLEIYLNTPLTTAEPDLLTEICIPVQKISKK